MTKMFEYVQYKKVDPELTSDKNEIDFFKEIAEQTLFTINMYFVENTTLNDFKIPGRRYQTNINRENKLLSTQSMECIHMALTAMLSSSQLFSKKNEY